MDVQTQLVMILLFGGIIYTTVMFGYRKLSQGQAFDLQRYATTLGYVALLALGSYIATGLIPDFAAILVQLEQGIPNAPELMALATSVGLGIINLFYKKQTGTTTPVPTIKPVAASIPQPVAATPSNYGIGKVLGIYGGSAKGNEPRMTQSYDVNMIPAMFFDVEVVKAGVVAMELIIDNVVQKKWMPDMQGEEPYQTGKFDVVGSKLAYPFSIWYPQAVVGEHTVNILLGYYDKDGKNPVWVSQTNCKITFTGVKFISE
jgi:hypothetical protein